MASLMLDRLSLLLRGRNASLRWRTRACDQRTLCFVKFYRPLIEDHAHSRSLRILKEIPLSKAPRWRSFCSYQDTAHFISSAC